jgi:hypothetical protein
MNRPQRRSARSIKLSQKGQDAWSTLGLSFPNVFNTVEPLYQTMKDSNNDKNIEIINIEDETNANMVIFTLS